MGLLGAVSGGISSLIGGGFNALGDALGISGAAREWKYKKKELNLQHELNEQSAEAAYERQMQMYKQSYEDNSYQAMREQMENAGLNVGLMYGNGGGGGGGAGSTTGAPQAQGAIAGGVTGDDMSLNYRSAQADIDLKEAEAKKAVAEANQLDKTGRKTDAETETIEKMRDIIFEHEKQKTWAQFIDNAIKDYLNDGSNFYENSNGVLETSTTKYWNETLNKGFTINGDSLTIRDMIAGIEKKIAETGEIGSQEELNKAMKQLTNEKADNYLMELSATLKNATANMTQAEAQKIIADARARQIGLDTGDEVNWMTGFKILVQAAGVISGNAKAAGMLLAAL